jgi:ubiquinone/menaquinone biosynthesis C-methylase UbiE
MAHHLAKDIWTDNERVQRMAKTYTMRYGSDFWKALFSLTSNDSRHVVADFGCGPGLFLADIANRFNAHTAIALDESPQMLAMAETNLKGLTKLKSIEIRLVNFDTDEIDIESGRVEFAFSGFMLHEVVSPRKFVSVVYRLVKSTGTYVVYDYVSGNEEKFVKAMAKNGMSEEAARKRYPHMCKHSVADIEEILETSGFSDCRSRTIDEFRAVVVGLKR